MELNEKLGAAIRIPTFWQADLGETEAALLDFQAFLVEKFPAFNAAAERWTPSPYSVVYRLPGEVDASAGAGEAALFLAHYDVVPAEAENWAGDPFGGETRDGFVHGRGALDMKGILVCLLEAAERLCAAGRKPRRDLWFAIGGDEERSGVLGALEAAKWFEARGQRFSWILDEGTPIAENQIKGVGRPVALVSIEEKGYLSLELAVEQEPGHASRPPRTQAAAVLGRALCRIAKKPFPFRLGSTVEAFFRRISPLVSGAQAFAMRRARALGPLFFKAAAGNPSIESMLRTTVAMTMLEGSAADNVLPSRAKAVINLRLLHPWTAEKAIEFVRNAIADERVRISVYGIASDPVAPGADCMSLGWPDVSAALEKAWPGVPALPFIMIATTDSRHYQKLSGSILRFTPFKIDPKELSGIHGHDERVSIENLERGLAFYSHLLEAL